MADPIIEILLFLGYLSVALISVVIAVYSLAVTWEEKQGEVFGY